MVTSRDLLHGPPAQRTQTTERFFEHLILLQRFQIGFKKSQLLVTLFSILLVFYHACFEGGRTVDLLSDELISWAIRGDPFHPLLGIDA
jgi:hypothetical protein